ncbi:MAG: exodeoxyribonuclease VII large subunit [Patescibacteria group bacterium]
MKIIKNHEVHTVSEINHFAKLTLEQVIVWVEGEVSALKKIGDYDFYLFDLKDGKNVLPCSANGSIVEALGSDISNQTVIAFGNLTLYEPSGKYQLRVQHLELSGEGQIYKKLEELIKKLREEGLFDSRNKKEIPLYPRKICIVSSIGSDGWNDFKTHTVEKFPITQLFTTDIRVQGPKSINDLLRVLPQVDQKGFDVVVITRGGGGLDDLAAFNNEDVARTIFKMKTPTVVAIGHEANESLAEWVADAHASTPTDAANIVTRGWQSILDKLNLIDARLESKFQRFRENNLQKLDYFYAKLSQEKMRINQYPHQLKRLEDSLKNRQKIIITDAQQEEKRLYEDLSKNAKSLIQSSSTTLIRYAQALNLLSPQNTLKRGYSLTTDENGRVIRSVASVVVGQKIGVKLSDGSLTSVVKSKSKK